MLGYGRAFIVLCSLATACADIGGRDGLEVEAADAGQPGEDAAPAVVPRPDSGPLSPGADAAPAVELGVIPSIRAAYTVDTDWIYVEWDIVDGETEYSQFCVTDDGPYAYKLEPGASDRGDFRYTYFHRNTLCDELTAAGKGGGTHTFWVQIWPGDDSARAQSSDVTGSLTCP